MSSYLRIDVLGGRFTLDLEVESEGQTNVHGVINRENPGDLDVSISNNKASIYSETEGAYYIKDYPLATSYKIREVGSSQWTVVNPNGALQTIQGVLDRPSSVIVADDSYVISDFIKPDLTSGHSETTEFVHNGDVDNGGAVILDSNSALIGFQAGTFVKATENIVDGRPYGRVQINLDKSDGSGGSAEAIDIRQGNVVSYPIISVSGSTTFAQDVEFEEDVILTSPNGSRYKLLVSNNGGLSTQAI